MAKALPIAYLNGEFLPVESARISPLDRGFLFGDAAYEVIAVYGGRPLLLDEHLGRLSRSLRELGIVAPHADDAWREIISELVTRNSGTHGHQDIGIYLQVSRGADTGRDHAFPQNVAPTVFAMASPLTAVDLPKAGVRAITAPDIRWGRCDIKTTSLLPNVLMRQSAGEAGAGEVIMLRDGLITEGSGSSVVIVEGRTLITRPNGPDILPGTTVRLIRDLALADGFAYREEPITEARLRCADEVWLTAALRGLAPVTHIDGRPVGNGTPGPIWRAVAQAYELRKRS